MAPLCYRRHRFLLEIIPTRHLAAFGQQFLDIAVAQGEAEIRGLDISYETVRRWVLKFGPAIARLLRQRCPRPSDRWLWRAVDDEGAAGVGFNAVLASDDLSEACIVSRRQPMAP